MVRNIILSTAPSSGGKTTYLNAFASIFKLPSIKLITDTDFIASSVLDDHRLEHGTHHTHPEHLTNIFGFVPNDFGGHDHKVNGPIPIWPFMVISNWITDRTLGSFWRSITEQPNDGLIFAELACGANGNQLSSPFAGVDISYNSLVAKFNRGELPKKALDRILLCIHPETSLKTRLRRSKLRADRPTAVTLIFAKDDFDYYFRVLLDENRIPILSFDNNIDLTIEEGEHYRFLETQLEINGYLEQLQRFRDEVNGSPFLKK